MAIRQRTRDFESGIKILVSLGIVHSGIEIPIEDEEIEAEAVGPCQLLLNGAGVVVAPTAQRLEILVRLLTSCFRW